MNIIFEMLSEMARKKMLQEPSLLNLNGTPIIPFFFFRFYLIELNLLATKTLIQCYMVWHVFIKAQKKLFSLKDPNEIDI